MVYRYWWNNGLHKEIQNNLKNRIYPYNEVKGIYNMVSNLYRARLKTFKQVIVLLSIMFFVSFLFNIVYIEDKYIAVMSVLVIVIFFILVMIYTYFIWVVKERNQFIKCIEIGCPDLVEKFEFSSFLECKIAKKSEEK